MVEYYLGIDLGKENKKTSAVCFLKEENSKILVERKLCRKCEDIFGRAVFEKIKPYLKKTKVIAIDSPITKGRGKGKMRLFEKFFSQKIFKKEKISPLPPAFIPEVSLFSQKIKKQLEKEGFVLDINLVETSARMVEKFLDKKFWREIPLNCQSKNQKSAFFSALVAYFHSCFQTKYIGYKDGFLFLPDLNFWKKEWREKFFQAWQERPRLKYRYLTTNFFQK